MRAAFLCDVKHFQVRQAPDPQAPDDGLLVRVHACGVCGSDLRRWKEGPYPGSEDLIAGHEIAGVVEAVGPLVEDYAPGNRLAVAPDIHCGRCYFCERGLYNLCDSLRLIGITPGDQGGFAEKMVITGEILRNGVVHRVRDGLEDLAAALAEPCSSVLAAHAKANTNLADTVLVMGAGPIGCLHIVVASARGARVILSEPAEQRRETARQFGPDLILDPTREDVVKRVREFTGGLGADIVICANPVPATQTQAVEAIRKGGRVVFFGGLNKANPTTALNANLIHYGEITVVGAFSYHPTFHQQALDLLARQIIPWQRIISHVLPLENINEAFTLSDSGEALKVMITL